jgi:NADH:quinone reductase (non-electrogenic)
VTGVQTCALPIFGDTKKGVLPVGQVQGLIHDLPTVAELFDRMVTEAKQAQAKVNAALS